MTTTDTQATAPQQTTGHTPLRRFRYGPNERWAKFLEVARDRGTTGSAVLVKAVDDYIADWENNPVTPTD